MEIKNLKSIISECILYADDISSNPEVYPEGSKMPLKDLLRYDMLMFLGYLYDPEAEVIADQVEYIRVNLRMVISEEKFVEFVDNKCNDPDFLSMQPRSLIFFINIDKQNSERSELSVSKSKFIVDCFRKLGEGFINYDKVSDEIKERLSSYMQFLYNTLIAEGVMKERRLRPREESQAPKINPIEDKDRQPEKTKQVSEFDAVSGKFVTKDTITSSGYKLIKKRADDVSQYANFISDEEKDSTKRGKNKVGANRHDGYSDDVELSLDDLIKKLKSLTGLVTVKEDVMHLVNIIKVRKLREMKGYRCPEMSFHLVFTGNPGTGKTTVARLIARIYKQLGVVSRGQFVEVDRSGLVDHSPGGTAIKTTAVIDKAVGGILFIDEAYTLTSYKDVGDYGQEAVDTLLKRMEDDRDDLIVIVAGYTDRMHEFIESNPGLRSRFNKYIYFTDYTSSELMEIFKLMCKENDYVLTDNAAFIAETYLRGLADDKTENFANARLVRNYFERCVDRQATRICDDAEINEDDLVTFIREDMIEGNAVGQLTKAEE
jgi:Cdc6-like AAA superfamily ATPase